MQSDNAVTSSGKPDDAAATIHLRKRIVAMIDHYKVGGGAPDIQWENISGKEEQTLNDLVKVLGPEPLPLPSGVLLPSDRDAESADSRPAVSSHELKLSHTTKQRVERILKKHAPRKLEKLKWEKYEGVEEELLESLLDRYGPEEEEIKNQDADASQDKQGSAAGDGPSSAKVVLPPIGDDTLDNIKKRITAMYAKYAPHKVAKLNWEKYDGRERDLLEALVEKHGSEPTQAVSTRMDPSSPADEKPAGKESLKKRIVAMYERHAPEKLAKLKWEKYEGDEEDLLEALIAKYGPEETRLVSEAEEGEKKRADPPTGSPRSEVPIGDDTLENIKKRITAMYEKYAPHKVAKLNWEKYDGRERDLLEALVEKHGAEPQQLPSSGEASGEVVERGKPAGPPSSSMTLSAAGETKQEGMTIKDRILAMYKKYAPHKVEKMKWDKMKGQETEFLEALVEKYGPEPAPTEDSTLPPIAASQENRNETPTAANPIDYIFAKKGVEVDSARSPLESITTTGLGMAPPSTNEDADLASSRKPEDTDSLPQGSPLHQQPTSMRSSRSGTPLAQETHTTHGPSENLREGPFLLPVYPLATAAASHPSSADIPPALAQQTATSTAEEVAAPDSVLTETPISQLDKEEGEQSTLKEEREEKCLPMSPKKKPAVYIPTYSDVSMQTPTFRDCCIQTNRKRHQKKKQRDEPSLPQTGGGDEERAAEGVERDEKTQVASVAIGEMSVSIVNESEEKSKTDERTSAEGITPQNKAVEGTAIVVTSEHEIPGASPTPADRSSQPHSEVSSCPSLSQVLWGDVEVKSNEWRRDVPFSTPKSDLDVEGLDGVEDMYPNHMGNFDQLMSSSSEENEEGDTQNQGDEAVTAALPAEQQDSETHLKAEQQDDFLSYVGRVSTERHGDSRRVSVAAPEDMQKKVKKKKVRPPFATEKSTSWAIVSWLKLLFLLIQIHVIERGRGVLSPVVQDVRIMRLIVLILEVSLPFLAALMIAASYFSGGREEVGPTHFLPPRGDLTTLGVDYISQGNKFSSGKPLNASDDLWGILCDYSIEGRADQNMLPHNFQYSGPATDDRKAFPGNVSKRGVRYCPRYEPVFLPHRVVPALQQWNEDGMACIGDERRGFVAFTSATHDGVPSYLCFNRYSANALLKKILDWPINELVYIPPLQDMAIIRLLAKYLIETGMFPRKDEFGASNLPRNSAAAAIFEGGSHKIYFKLNYVDPADPEGKRVLKFSESTDPRSTALSRALHTCRQFMDAVATYNPSMFPYIHGGLLGDGSFSTGAINKYKSAFAGGLPKEAMKKVAVVDSMSDILGEVPWAVVTVKFNGRESLATLINRQTSPGKRTVVTLRMNRSSVPSTETIMETVASYFSMDERIVGKEKEKAEDVLPFWSQNYLLSGFLSLQQSFAFAGRTMTAPLPDARQTMSELKKIVVTPMPLPRHKFPGYFILLGDVFPFIMTTAHILIMWRFSVMVRSERAGMAKLLRVNCNIGDCTMLSSWIIPFLIFETSSAFLISCIVGTSAWKSSSFALVFVIIWLYLLCLSAQCTFFVALLVNILPPSVPTVRTQKRLGGDTSEGSEGEEEEDDADFDSTGSDTDEERERRSRRLTRQKVGGNLVELQKRHRAKRAVKALKRKLFLELSSVAHSVRQAVDVSSFMVPVIICLLAASFFALPPGTPVPVVKALSFFFPQFAFGAATKSMSAAELGSFGLTLDSIDTAQEMSFFSVETSIGFLIAGFFVYFVFAYWTFSTVSLVQKVLPQLGSAVFDAAMTLTGEAQGDTKHMEEVKKAQARRGSVGDVRPNECLRIEGLCVTRESETLLREVDLSLKFGTSVAITGSTKAGKSTLLKVLCGEVDPTSGNVCFSQAEGGKRATAHPKVGFCDQEGTLWPWATPLESLMFLTRLKLYGHHLALNPKYFSKGQRKKRRREPDVDEELEEGERGRSAAFSIASLTSAFSWRRGKEEVDGDPVPEEEVHRVWKAFGMSRATLVASMPITGYPQQVQRCIAMMGAFLCTPQLVLLDDPVMVFRRSNHYGVLGSRTSDTLNGSLKHMLRREEASVEQIASILTPTSPPDRSNSTFPVSGTVAANGTSPRHRSSDPMMIHVHPSCRSSVIICAQSIQDSASSTDAVVLVHEGAVVCSGMSEDMKLELSDTDGLIIKVLFSGMGTIGGVSYSTGTTSNHIVSASGRYPEGSVQALIQRMSPRGRILASTQNEATVFLPFAKAHLTQECDELADEVSTFVHQLQNSLGDRCLRMTVETADQALLRRYGVTRSNLSSHTRIKVGPGYGRYHRGNFTGSSSSSGVENNIAESQDSPTKKTKRGKLAELFSTEQNRNEFDTLNLSKESAPKLWLRRVFAAHLFMSYGRIVLKQIHTYWSLLFFPLICFTLAGGVYRANQELDSSSYVELDAPGMIRTLGDLRIRTDPLINSPENAFCCLPDGSYFSKGLDVIVANGTNVLPHFDDALQFVEAPYLPLSSAFALSLYLSRTTIVGLAKERLSAAFIDNSYEDHSHFAFFNLSFRHGAPFALASTMEAMLRSHEQVHEHSNLTFASDVLPLAAAQRQIYNDMATFVVALLVGLPLALAPAVGFKHLMHLRRYKVTRNSDTSPSSLFFSVMLMDMLYMVPLLLILFLIGQAFEMEELVYVRNNTMIHIARVAFLHQLTLSSLNCILFWVVRHVPAYTPSTLQYIYSLVVLLVTSITLGMQWSMLASQTMSIETAQRIRFFFRLFPSFSLCETVLNMVRVSIEQYGVEGQNPQAAISVSGYPAIYLGVECVVAGSFLVLVLLKPWRRWFPVLVPPPKWNASPVRVSTSNPRTPDDQFEEDQSSLTLQVPLLTSPIPDARGIRTPPPDESGVNYLAQKGRSAAKTNSILEMLDGLERDKEEMSVLKGTEGRANSSMVQPSKIPMVEISEVSITASANWFVALSLRSRRLFNRAKRSLKDSVFSVCDLREADDQEAEEAAAYDIDSIVHQRLLQDASFTIFSGELVCIVSPGDSRASSALMAGIGGELDSFHFGEGLGGKVTSGGITIHSRFDAIHGTESAPQRRPRGRMARWTGNSSSSSKMWIAYDAEAYPTSVVYNNDELFPSLTAETNIMHFIMLRNSSKAMIQRTRILTQLKRLCRLNDVSLTMPFCKLPLLARRKVSIACTIAAFPPVVCFDSPFTGFESCAPQDVEANMKEIINVLESLRSIAGMTVILSSSSLEQIQHIPSARVILLSSIKKAGGVDGHNAAPMIAGVTRVIFDGTIAETYSKVGSMYYEMLANVVPQPGLDSTPSGDRGKKGHNSRAPPFIKWLNALFPTMKMTAADGGEMPFHGDITAYGGGSTEARCLLSSSQVDPLTGLPQYVPFCVLVYHAILAYGWSGAPGASTLRKRQLPRSMEKYIPRFNSFTVASNSLDSSAITNYVSYKAPAEVDQNPEKEKSFSDSSSEESDSGKEQEEEEDLVNPSNGRGAAIFMSRGNHKYVLPQAMELLPPCLQRHVGRQGAAGGNRSEGLSTVGNEASQDHRTSRTNTSEVRRSTPARHTVGSDITSRMFDDFHVVFPDNEVEALPTPKSFRRKVVLDDDSL